MDILAVREALIRIKEDAINALDYWDQEEETELLPEYLDSILAGVNTAMAAADMDLVRPQDGCPECDERRMDYLVWTSAYPEGEIEDDYVHCATCGTDYSLDSPPQPEVTDASNQS